MSPIAWALRPLKNYGNFSGRASRAEFWWFFLFLMIGYIVMWIALFAFIGIAAGASSPNRSPWALFGVFGVLGIFMLLFWLAMLIPVIAVQVRRLHDTDRSGWWLGAFYLLYAVYAVVLIGSLGRMMSAGLAAGNQPPDLNQPLFIFGQVLGFGMFVYGITLIVFFCLQGTKGPNRFGDDPYGADVEEVFA